MNENGLRTEYGRLLDERRPLDRGGCPDPEALASVVGGSLDEGARLELLRHVGDCTSCREELDLLRATAAAARGSARRVVPRWAAAAVLVLAAGAVLWRVAGDGAGPEVMRGSASGMELVAPRDDVAAATSRTFTWRAVESASVYAFELLTTTGEVRFATETPDTVLMLPESVPLAAGADYQWWVRARTLEGGAVASPVQAFRVRER